MSRFRVQGNTVLVFGQQKKTGDPRCINNFTGGTNNEREDQRNSKRDHR